MFHNRCRQLQTYGMTLGILRLAILPQLSIALDLFVRHHAHNMLQAIPRQHSLLPTREVGIVGRVPGVLCISHDEWDLRIPNNEGEVRVCTFIANKPGTVREMGVEDGGDAFDLVVVAFTGRRERLMMEYVEPVW